MVDICYYIPLRFQNYNYLYREALILTTIITILKATVGIYHS